jgi:hypothetical protein
MLAGSSLLLSNTPFHIQGDTALRVRLDDTLTSVDSQVGDPFSTTVVDEGEFRNARVYGHLAGIETSGRIKGRTSMALRFDRLIMPDGRRAPIRAEIVELYHAPSGEKVDVEGAIESGGRGGKASLIPPSGRELAPCWAESSEGVREPGIGSIIGGAGGLGTTAFHGRQKITLNNGQEMLIRITGR